VLTSDRHANRTADFLAEYSLLRIVQIRFRDFEAKFGRSPRPDDPIFFDDSLDRPAKATTSQLRAQLEQAAREVGVRVDPVLCLLGLDAQRGRAQQNSISHNRTRNAPTPYAQWRPSIRIAEKSFERRTAPHKGTRMSSPHNRN